MTGGEEGKTAADERRPTVSLSAAASETYSTTEGANERPESTTASPGATSSASATTASSGRPSTSTAESPTATETEGAPTVAVAHYPEGAGHATRMLAVAEALSDRGAEVLMAGGGAGTEFVALNGYDEFEPTVVDYIDTVQAGSLRQVLTGSVPASANRVADYADWLRETAPDALVTDDMFAAMAALRVDVPLYVLKHDMPALYRNRLERAGAAFHTDFQVEAAREFFYPAVWPAAGLAPEGATRIPPVALGGAGRDREGADVVVVPSYYSDLEQVTADLEQAGHDVIDVGSDAWEPVPSLLPYIRDADVVVCSGYSTVMDTAVAGTPCVVYPATEEQEAVADRLRDDAATGFVVAENPSDVLAAVADPPDSPGHDNGAPHVAETVLADLETDDLASPTDDRESPVDGRASPPDGRASTADDGPTAGHGVHGRAAAAVTAGGQTRDGDRGIARARQSVQAVRRGVRGVQQGTRVITRTALATARGGTPSTAATESAAPDGRGDARPDASAVRNGRRYALATSALLASVALFARCRLRRVVGDR
ncbi:MAG: glycosyltransferase [Haloglomus sp.]